MKKKPESRDEARNALFAEVVRAAVLAENPAPKDEVYASQEAAVLAAVWSLYNPLGLAGRETSFFALIPSDTPQDPDLPPIPPRRKYFSAHVHPGEPLTESPDDLLRYHLLDLEHGAGVCCILDGPDGKILG